MQVKASLKNFRMSPRKVRLAADLVRGKTYFEAKVQLQFIKGKTGTPILDLLESCVANGVHNFGLEKSNLYIENIEVDEGPVMKRWRPRAHGRAYSILKRTSHLGIILNEIEEGKGRTKVERKEAKTLTYEELKKITKQADKILNKQQERKEKDQKDQKLGKDKKSSSSRAISKIFRRKSI
jgi:large subunit ribosomal protein L22